MVADRRLTFCAGLKAAREKKGISLDHIAASTKISRSLLKGLENGDVSRWPSGLYRRSYLRDYLRAIDLAPESTVAEFARLFPEEGALPIDTPPVHEPDESPLSILMAEDQPDLLSKGQKRIVAATIDIVAVLIASAAAWWLLQADVWASGTIVAVCYYSVGTAALGRSFGSRCLEGRSWRRSATSTSLTIRPDSLLARFRPGVADPSMADLSGLPANAALFRTLFLR